MIEIFIKGGPIMWPLLALSLIAFTVVLERLVFIVMEKCRRRPSLVGEILTLVERGDPESAARLGNESNDFVARALGYALSHREKSFSEAMLRAANRELKRFNRGLTILDTAITLAPLLGLLGTVTGIMGSFQKMGESSIAGAMTEIQGGIGEALIATAAGLGIAIVGVFFLNIYNEMMEKLKFDLETAATNVEVMVTQARQEGFDTAAFRRDVSAKNA